MHDAHPASTDRQSILGAPVDPVDLGAVLARVGAWLDAADGVLRHVVTVNPEFVVAARRDAAFREALLGADLATADGVGIVLAQRLLGLPVAPRVTGVDLVEGLAGLRHSQARLFLLGAAPGVAEEAAKHLRARHSGIQIAGTFAGSPANTDFSEIERRLAAVRPTILLVAFGHPRQDLWIAEHRERLSELGVVVASGIGGVFDYVSGRVPRPPRLARRLGLEWLYRLVRQPWRWRRQLALPVFVALVVRERVRGGRPSNPDRLSRGEKGGNR